jgi:hypothetical protein
MCEWDATYDAPNEKAHRREDEPLERALAFNADKNRLQSRPVQRRVGLL